MTTVWDSTVQGYEFNYDKIIFGAYDINDQKEMVIKYPKGSRAGAKVKGGCGFYGYPKDKDDKKIFPLNDVTFEYEVFFDPKFDFVKGGKLPGLYGGKTGANGGTHLDDGFSKKTISKKQSGA